MLIWVLGIYVRRETWFNIIYCRSLQVSMAKSCWSFYRTNPFSFSCWPLKLEVWESIWLEPTESSSMTQTGTPAQTHRLDTHWRKKMFTKHTNAPHIAHLKKVRISSFSEDQRNHTKLFLWIINNLFLYVSICVHFRLETTEKTFYFSHDR